MGTRDRSGGRGRKGGVFWISVIVGLGLVLGAACYFGYPLYRGWQANRAVRLAKSFLEKRDTRSGVLSLQTALRHRPDNLEAHSVAASLLEDFGSRESLLHRRRLMELQPQLLEPKLEFARAALKYNNPLEAEKALGRIQGQDRKNSEFLELQAELFAVGGRTDKAVTTYHELLVLHPEDKGAHVKLAILALQGSREQERASARMTLESLASDSEFALLALRALTQDALRREDLPAALSWSGRLIEMPSAEFSDQLLRAHALFITKSSAYESWLTKLETMASENPRLAFELGKWENSALGPQKAVAWLVGTPKSVRDMPLIGVLIADCYSALNRWTDLESLVRWTSWRALEPLRLAFLARAQAGQDNVQKSEGSWRLALAAAERQPAQLVPLLAMARADKRDVREVLWLIAQKDPRQVWARKELYQTYSNEGNCAEMLRMMELMLKENPKDQAAKYNVAGLLMVTGVQIERAGVLAKELYEADSKTLGNAVLYAYGLMLQGKPEKGAKLLDSREDLDQLGNDGRAYYALIISACGRGDEARRFAKAVDRQQLLPELRTSLDQVIGSVSASADVNPKQF